MKNRAEEPDRWVDVTIPMLPEMELTAARTADAVAGFAGLNREKTEEVKMALIEACINAFEHSRSEEQRVDIHFRIEPDILTVQVTDEGQGFDSDRARRDAVEKRKRGERYRGWGLRIMEKMMDEIEIQSEEKGTVITMVKHR